MSEYTPEIELHQNNPETETRIQSEVRKAECYFDQPQLLKTPIYRAAYSDRTAWIMAECSRLAYKKFEINKEERKELVACLSQGDFSLIDTFNLNETQAFLSENDRFVVLAFRGTEKKVKDWKSDANILLKKTKYGRIHKGFHSAYLNIHNQLFKTLSGIKKPIYITGHSLGGALASIATSYLNRDNIAACYTFGAPSIGTVKFEMQLSKTPLYRVVNSGDAIPKLLDVFPFYYHPGFLCFLTKSGHLIRSPGTWKKIKHFTVSTFQRLIKRSYHGHAIKSYVSKLKHIAESRNENLF